MLDSLSTRLQAIFDKLGGRGRLSEENIQEALREVRVALLEADVNFKVVRAFVDRVRTRAVGQDVLASLTPAQQVVKVVHGELVELLGGSGHRLAMASHPPTVIMLMGLQGSGKTTTAAKLARLYTKQGQHPLLAAADTQRPAAMEQLRTLGAQVGVPVTGAPGQTPLEICRAAREEAAARGLTPLILDTAGRLHIDEVLLGELQAIRREVAPHHVLLVVDAMTGQDAVTVADRFNQAVGIDAVILTKLDGDSRGGAALSVRQITGAPIKFAGISEKIDGLEVFDAERHAGRVLGMGDIVALVEEVQKGVDLQAAQKLADKVKSGAGFDLNDFLAQISQMKNMGGLSGLIDKLPTQMMGKAQPGQADMDRAERDVRRMEGIICSMTALERRKPELIKASRKRRIAAGAGVQVQEVNRLLNQFEQMQGMMKKMKGGGLMKMMKRMGGMKGLPGMR